MTCKPWQSVIKSLSFLVPMVFVVSSKCSSDMSLWPPDSGNSVWAALIAFRTSYIRTWHLSRITIAEIWVTCILSFVLYSEVKTYCKKINCCKKTKTSWSQQFTAWVREGFLPLRHWTQKSEKKTPFRVKEKHHPVLKRFQNRSFLEKLV